MNTMEIFSALIRWSDLDFYLNYDGDNKPTVEMIEYANSIVDNYTAQLIEGGII